MITEGFSEGVILRPVYDHEELSNAEWVEEYSGRGWHAQGRAVGLRHCRNESRRFTWSQELAGAWKGRERARVLRVSASQELGSNNCVQVPWILSQGRRKGQQMRREAIGLGVSGEVGSELPLGSGPPREWAEETGG